MHGSEPKSLASLPLWLRSIRAPLAATSILPLMAPPPHSTEEAHSECVLADLRDFNEPVQPVVIGRQLRLDLLRSLQKRQSLLRRRSLRRTRSRMGKVDPTQVMLNWLEKSELLARRLIWTQLHSNGPAIEPLDSDLAGDKSDVLVTMR